VYDQTDNPGTSSVSSQNFEKAYYLYDDQAADDFAVPPSDGAWTIQNIQILGAYWNGTGPLTSVNVWFYGNAGGLPGSQVSSQLGLVPASDAGGDLVLHLPSPPTLPPGTYWLSVQANMNRSSGGQWGWSTRAVQSYSPFAWRNPGNGYGSGCTAWTTNGACGFTYGPDLLFRLSGTKATTPTPTNTPSMTPTPIPTSTATPTNTPTPTSTPTDTPTPTPTDTFTPTPTPQGPDTDGDGVPDSVDNCPSVFNPGQENTDAAIDNGPGISGDDTTIPNAVTDNVGDACETDPDIDYDGLPNSEDTNPLGATGICAAFADASDGHPNPAGGDVTNDDNHDGNPAPPMGTDSADNGPSWDTDGDGVRDGVECTLGHNPRSRTDRPSTADCGGTGDSDGDGLPDAWETCKWGTNPAVIDSDGDTLGDCKEAADVDGDGQTNLHDVVATAKAALLADAAFGKDGDFDIDGDSRVNLNDVVQEAKVALIAGLCK
jgi:hypothetical protein